MSTPEEIKEFADKFKYGTWRNYSYEELAQWVSLLTKRASHRTDPLKAQKDLKDADNYLKMMNSKFTEDFEKVVECFVKNN